MAREALPHRSIRWSDDAGLDRKVLEELVCVCIDCFDLSTRQQLCPDVIVEPDSKGLAGPQLLLSPNPREKVSHMLVTKSVAYKQDGVVLK